MRVYFPILFLTLVLSLPAAFAAPTVDHDPPPIEMSPRDVVEEIPSYHQENRDWALRLGFLGGALKENSQAEQLYLYGVRYSFARKTLEAWEIEVMTGGQNFLHFVVGKKFYFPLESVTLPYYKFSVGNLVDAGAGESMGAVLNIKKIQAMAAVGLDDLFSWDRRLQAEIGVAGALVGYQFEMSLGIAF